MRVTRINSRESVCYRRLCPKCTQPAQLGEVVLHIEIKGAPFDQRHVVFHTDCLQKALDEAPAPTRPVKVKRKVNKITAAMLSTGTFFPPKVKR